MGDSLRPFGIVLEKSIKDLIRGIRASRDATSRELYIKSALAECRQEVKSPDLDVKTMAVLKLAYLEMYGHDLSWAGFHILEVMASPRLSQKRVGYLAATQSFRSESDVLMLSTNLIKKDLTSASYLEVSTCLGGVASIVTPSLAADISADVSVLLNHSKPLIRKKAVLAIFKVVVQYPEALTVVFPRIKDKLSDPDPSVVSATVNVLCELAKQLDGDSSSQGSVSPALASTAAMYLQAAPRLYELLTTSKNNWMLIKILKFFSLMAPFEPRLKPKLLPPVFQIMQTSQATSLLYECVNCLISGNMIDSETDEQEAQICVAKLVEFIEQSDPNLRFVGLQALLKIVKLHADLVTSFKIENCVLNCIDDSDVTIRESILQLIGYIVNEDNLYTIVTRLVDLNRIESGDGHVIPAAASSSSHTSQVVNTIIKVCSANTYAHVPDFDWFVEVLSQLALMVCSDSDTKVSSVAENVGKQIRDVAVRVPSVRGSCVELSIALVSSEQYAGCSMIPFAVWVLGEYASYMTSPVEVLETLITAGQTIGENEGAGVVGTSNHPDSSSAANLLVLVPAIIKIFANWAKTWSNPAMIRVQLESIIRFLEKTSTNRHYEVQERTIEFLELMKLIQESLDEHHNEDGPPLLLSVVLASLFNGSELRPVGKNAMRKIILPSDLDLDESIFDVSEPPELRLDVFSDTSSDEEYDSEHKGETREAAVDLETLRKQRQDRIRDDPFYISDTKATAGELDAEAVQSGLSSASTSRPATPSGKSRIVNTIPRKKVEILMDEGSDGEEDNDESGPKNRTRRKGILGNRSRLADVARSNSPFDGGEEENAVQKLRSELETVEVRHKKVKKDKSSSEKKKKSKKKKKKVSEDVEAKEQADIEMKREPPTEP